MAVPYTFATATTSIPLSQLDANFATSIVLGNTAVYLGNTTTSLGNLTLTNATISSVATTFPNSFLANSSVTLGSTNVSLGGTASTLANVTLSNVTITSGSINITNVSVSNITVTGGTIDNTPIGNTTASSGKFTTLSATGQLTLTNASNYNLYASGAGANYMAGNLGVGTTSPNGKLDVNGGNVYNTTTATGATGFYTNNGTRVNSFNSDFNANATYIDVNGNSYIRDVNAGYVTRLAIQSGTISLGAAPGSESLRVVPVASVVNYLAAYGAATTASPALYSLGSDTNIDMSFLPKGNGGIFTYGVGQTTSSIDTTKLGSGIGLFDSGVATGNGGSIIFGAASGTWRFAAIKAAVTNGSSNTQGDLYFSTRRNVTDSTLTPAMQITSGGIAYLGGSSGNQSLAVTPVASAVNYFNFYGATTGGAPTIYSTGSDANIDFNLVPKGTGAVNLFGNGNVQFRVQPTASAVNYLQVTGAVTGDGPSLTSSGSDANINLKYFAKGTGYHFFYGVNTAQFAIAPTTSAVNYLQVTGGSTGNAALLQAAGSDTNIGIGIYSKGTYGIGFYGASGTPQFVVQPTSSSVNYIQVTGNATGFGPALSAQGSDTNVYLALNSKGVAPIYYTGSTHYFNNSSNQAQFAIASTASAVNYILSYGGVTGGSPVIAAIGSDTNINLFLAPKGAGVLQFGTYTAGVLTPTGYITIVDAANNTRRLLVG